MNNVFRVLSLNADGRTTKLSEQVDMLLSHDPDLVTIQEVKRNTAPRLADRFTAAGYHVEHSLALRDCTCAIMRPCKRGLPRGYPRVGAPAGGLLPKWLLQREMNRVLSGWPVPLAV